ncbi:MAG: hypothetical protein IJ193_06370 [Bacilli bacterium]|nr:hypothetical protein [Bacilli bacterium]
MKKKIFLLALVAFVFLTGCSLKQSEKETSTNEKESVATSVEGKYRLEDEKRKGTVYQGFEKYLTFEGKNVVVEDEYYGSTYTGTYTLKDGKLNMIFTQYKDDDGSKEVVYKLIGKATTKNIKLTKETKDGLTGNINEVFEPVKEK